MACRAIRAFTLWLRGYPDKAQSGMLEALTLARQLSHPFSLAWALNHTARLHYLRREGQAAQEWIQSQLPLSGEHGFPYWLAVGTILRGWALAEQGKSAEGISQLCRGLAAHQATGSNLNRPDYLAMLAEAYGKAGQAEAGLYTVAEALAAVDRTEERFYEAELYRLKGELSLQKSRVGIAHHDGTVAEAGTVGGARPTGEEEAEVCFLKAIDIARKQQAKSLELRAATSLARLWRQQGKQAEARQMLAEVYNWFTEGFDTKDLQEAKALLEELGR
jgi:predicted ATPase